MKSPNKKNRLRLLIIAVVLLIAAGVAIKLIFFAPKAPDITTTTVNRGDIEESVLATGILKPAKWVAVGAQVSGRLTAVDVSMGETVKKGQLIAQIDSQTQENNLRTAEAALADVRAQREQKQAQLTYDKQVLARQTTLYGSSAVSQGDYQSALADVAEMQAQIKSIDAQIIEAQVAVQTAKVNLGYTRITAPMSGTVLSIVSHEGQTVNAQQSVPTIVILGQLDTMRVLAEISEADITKVKPGLPVYFTILSAPDHRYEAKLASIYPAPDSITSDSSLTSSTTSSSSSSSSSSSAIYYNGIFDVPNPTGVLRTYMTAEVHIILGQAKDVLLIPSAALRQNGDGSYSVRVIGADGRITSRKVEVGLNNKIDAEIRSGLKAGERIVTSELAAGTTTSTDSRPGPPPMGL